MPHLDAANYLFHPRRGKHDADTVMFPVSEKIKISGQWYPAGKTGPLLLFFHGNGEIATDYEFLAYHFNSLQIGLLVVDYRGYGSSDGNPAASTMLEDAHAIYDQLPDFAKTQGIDPRAVLVMGRSLGSAAAIELAANAQRKPSALILDSPFAETWGLIRRLGGEPPKGATEDDGFANETKMARVTMPCLIIHGSEDRIIPHIEGQRLYDAARSQEKRLLTIAGAGHNDLLSVDGEGYFHVVGELVGALER